MKRSNTTSNSDDTEEVQSKNVCEQDNNGDNSPLSINDEFSQNRPVGIQNSDLCLKSANNRQDMIDGRKR